MRSRVGQRLDTDLAPINELMEYTHALPCLRMHRRNPRHPSWPVLYMLTKPVKINTGWADLCNRTPGNNYAKARYQRDVTVGSNH